MQNKNISKQFNRLFFFSYGVCAIGTTQMIPYLLKQGYQGIEKGFILSGMAIFTIFSQFLFGYLSDRYRGVKNFFLCTFIIFFIFASILFAFEIDWFGYWLLLISLVGGISRTWQGLEDTWVLQIDQVKENYSRIRAYGAIGWAIGSWIAAILLSFFNFKVLSTLILILSLFTLVLTYKIQDVNRASGKIIKVEDLKILFRSKSYLLLVAILLVLFAMGTADMYIVVDKILAIGGTSFHVGAKWGFQSIMEVPILLLGSQLLKRFKPINLMFFAAIMFGLRFVIYSFIQDPWWMIISASIQLLTFPIVIFSSKVLIDEITEIKVKSSGQMMAMSIYMGLSLLLMPILCSFLAKTYGYDQALLIVASFSIFAIVLIIIYKKEMKN